MLTPPSEEMQMTPKTPGASTPMPSLKLELPQHVTVRKRKDGTYRVLFEVRRDKPPGWKSAIPLPYSGRRTGNLNDADEVARIFADVEGPGGLLERLEQERAALVTAGETPGTLRAAVALWKASDDWKDLRPRTQEFYEAEVRLIDAWSESAKRPQLAMLTLPKILAYLNTFNNRPAQKAAIRRTLSTILSFARNEGIIKANPLTSVIRIRRPKGAPKATVIPWGAADVAQYAEIAVEQGWIGGAILLRSMWETSADASDVVTWRKREHFKREPIPHIAYTRGKTGIGATTPISPTLAAYIEQHAGLYLVTDPKGAVYKADDIRDDRRRGHHFRMLRASVVDRGGRSLVFDHLRHSAATDAIDKGASFEQTRSITAHKDDAMLRQVYVQNTWEQALAVQRARGIIE